MTATGPRRNLGRHPSASSATSRPQRATVTSLRQRSGEAPRHRRRSGGTHATAPSTVVGLMVVVLALCAVGLVMVLSASAADAQNLYGTPWYQFQRQALWLVVGALALGLGARVDLARVRATAQPLLWLTGGLLILVLLPFAGQTVNGASRWLELGPLTLQPSELAKLALAVFVADLLARRAQRIDDLRLTLVPVLTVLVVIGGLVLLQPNLGTAVILVVMVLGMLWVAGLPAAPLVAVAGVSAGGAAVMAVLAPYRLARLTAFMDPWADRFNTGYQTLQSQAAHANGGATGLGLGQGRAKFGFLPEGHTDFIFSTIGEEFGLAGSLVLVGLFVALAYFGTRVALGTRDLFRMVLAAGITIWITLQALVNLGAVVGVLPITGVPLPLVSAGGSSLVVTMAACGILLNIARTTRR
jgi:cell division protein FtsW